MVQNDPKTGRISYVGKKHTMINFDPAKHRWNMSVINNPKIQAISNAELASLVIGKHEFIISGDNECSAADQVNELSLTSCSITEFTCDDGMCIDRNKRCNNIIELYLNNFLPSENKLIWIPELVFENTEDKMRSKINEKTSIKVLKSGNFTPSHISENENIQIFRGDENMLIMRQFYTLTFLSDFKMAWYPFDLQELKMHLTMDSGFAPFVMFNLEEVVYNGKGLLTKYEVQDVEMFITEWENNEAITFEIILGRKLLSVLMNVIVPTLILNTISFTTNFYTDEYFESKIGINLTSILLLVAFFVSVRFL